MRPVFGLAAVIALGAAGCHQTITGSAAADAPRITGVSVSGNKGVDDDDIVDGLANHPPEGFFFRRTYRRFDRFALEQDIARIESYYQSRGFYSAKVVGTDVQPDGEHAVRVTFRVVEGQPTRVSGLSVAGLGGSLARRHKALDREKKKLRVGDIFRYDRYEDLKTWLLDWMSRRGYPHAQVRGKVDVDRNARTADIRFLVDTGPLSRFGKTEILGRTRVPESAIWNRIAWKPGDRFDPVKLEVTQGRLYQLGLFSTVRTDFERAGRPRDTDIHISVTDARPQELRLGGGVEVSGGFDPQQGRILVRGRGDYVLRGVFSPLNTLHLEARPGWEWLPKQEGDEERKNNAVGEATATLERADLFIPRMTGQVAVGVDQTQYEAYVAVGPLARLGLSRPFLGDRLQASLGWRFRYLWFNDQDPALVDPPAGDGDPQIASAAAIIHAEDDYRLGVLEQTLSYDRRDDPLNARRGMYASINLNEGAAPVGSAFRYMRATGDLRGYLPLGERVVLAARAFYGRAVGNEVLPATERFYDGGANGHRGFAFRQLSPLLTRTVADDMGGERQDTTLLGGDETFLGSGEVRVDLTRIKGFPLGVVGFADGGDVVCRIDGLANQGEFMDRAVCPPLDFFNLHWATGVGLRYDPIISIRFDVAYRLNRYELGEPAAGERFAFHFSLGQAF